MSTLEDFLRDYYYLCIKHGYRIDGCGCCGSPYIVDKDGIYVNPLENALDAEGLDLNERRTNIHQD